MQFLLNKGGLWTGISLGFGNLPLFIHALIIMGRDIEN